MKRQNLNTDDRVHIKSLRMIDTPVMCLRVFPNVQTVTTATKIIVRWRVNEYVFHSLCVLRAHCVCACSVYIHVVWMCQKNSDHWNTSTSIMSQCSSRRGEDT